MSRNPWEPHVEPVNRLVDELSGVLDDASCPYASPEHGGTEAAVLSILSNPGNGAAGRSGSGFLTINNSDPTSRVQRELFAAVGIGMRDITPWNACPWYINGGKPSLPEIYKGVAVAASLSVLPRLVALMPKLKVVLLQGIEAKTAWEAFVCVHPERVETFTVVSTFHPLGTRRKDPAARNLAVQQQRDAYAKVAKAART
jgi:hypothetical protein